MKTKPTGAKRVWNIVSGVLIAIMVVLVVMLVGVRLIGYQPYCVLSGSMEPTYHTGSLIYVKKPTRRTSKSATRSHSSSTKTSRSLHTES